MPAPGTELTAGGRSVGTLGSVSRRRRPRHRRASTGSRPRSTPASRITAGDVAVSLAIPAWAKFTFPQEAASRRTPDGRPSRRAAARLAAHAVRPPARSARPLAARHRDLRHRPWACPRRPLERPDLAATTPSRSRSIRCWSRRFSASCVPDASPDARLAALLHDAPEYVIGDMISPFKSVIGGDYKARRAAASARHPSALFAACRQPGETLTRGHQARRPDRRLFRGDRLAGFSTAEATKFFGRPRGFSADNLAAGADRRENGGEALYPAFRGTRELRVTVEAKPSDGPAP